MSRSTWARCSGRGSSCCQTVAAETAGRASLLAWLALVLLSTGTVVAALVAGEYAARCVGGGREAAFAFGGGLVVAACVLNLAGLRESSAARAVTLAAIAPHGAQPARSLSPGMPARHASG